MPQTDLLNRLFEQHNITAKVVRCIEGDAITRYEVEVDPFTVRIESFHKLEDNIAYLLRSREKPVVVPMYERGAIAIDVINRNRSDLHLHTIWNEVSGLPHCVPIVLGHNIDKQPYVIDLADAPHLLIAGTTGSGKSVGLRSMIASLLHYRRDVQFIFIDPKCVELTVFDKLPDRYHKVEGVITDPEDAIEALRYVLGIIEGRYHELAKRGVNNISQLKGKYALPHVVIVIDELADLFAANKRIDALLLQIIQKSRAAGIHIIAATQRPSVDVVTGIIKANFPARVAFKVSSYEDSRTVLGRAGAERLLGRGDMLYRMSADSFERIQSAYISNSDLDKLVTTLRKKNKWAFLRK